MRIVLAAHSRTLGSGYALASLGAGSPAGRSANQEDSSPMTMVVKDINDQQWTDFVGASSQALPFHHPSWAQLLGACYGYRPFALALTDANGGIRAGLPVLEVSGPLG